MSFSLTTRQVRAGTKTVTRRLGWWNVKPAERLCAVEKSQGIPKGESVKRIRTIEVVSARNEQLRRITARDVAREGFPWMTRREFIEMFCRHNKCEPTAIVRRIEFSYVT